MSGLGSYIEYIKDNPDHYWFKRKIFGWGWTPATWEGWVVTIVIITFVVWNGITLGSNTAPTDNEIFWFFTRIGAAIILLIVICYRTGESPRWQWGIPKKSSDNVIE